MISSIELLFVIAMIFFIVAGVVTARSRTFDWQNFGLAILTAGLMLAL